MKAVLASWWFSPGPYLFLLPPQVRLHKPGQTGKPFVSRGGGLDPQDSESREDGPQRDSRPKSDRLPHRVCGPGHETRQVPAERR